MKTRRQFLVLGAQAGVAISGIASLRPLALGAPILTLEDVFLQPALTVSPLEQWGSLAALSAAPGESDESLRRRIMKKPENQLTETGNE